MIPVLGSGAPASGDAGTVGTTSRGRSDTGSGGDFGQILGVEGTSPDAPPAFADAAHGSGNGGNFSHPGGKDLPGATATSVETEGPGGAAQSLLADALAVPSTVPPVAATPSLAQTTVVSPASPAGLSNAPDASDTSRTIQAVAQRDAPFAQRAIATGLVPGSSSQGASGPNVSLNMPGAVTQVTAGDALLPEAPATAPTAVTTAHEGVSSAATGVQATPVAAQVVRAVAATPNATQATDGASINPVSERAAYSDNGPVRSADEVVQRVLGSDERMQAISQAVAGNGARAEVGTGDVVLSKAAEATSASSTGDGARILAASTAPAAGSSASLVAAPLTAPIADAVAPGAARPAVTGMLHAHPGEPAWNSDVAGRVSLMMRNGASEASLQLNPPELGRLDIKIATDGDAARVLFTVQGAETRELLEQAMPRLREMLEESGLSLSRFDVADQNASNPGNDSHFEPGVDGADAEADTLPGHSPVQRIAAEARGLVDYYV
ncbi:MAG: flagellar hook-length control protein FliK [Halioglobus sp.]